MNGEEYVIGRMPDYCQILIQDYSGVVSRQHLWVLFDQESAQYIAEDRASTNGTYRGGIRLRHGVKYRIPPGTELELSPLAPLDAGLLLLEAGCAFSEEVG